MKKTEYDWMRLVRTTVKYTIGRVKHLIDINK